MIISKTTQTMVAASLHYRCIIVAESPHRKYYLKSNASYGYSNVTFSLHFCNDNPPIEPPRRQVAPNPPTFRGMSAQIPPRSLLSYACCPIGVRGRPPSVVRSAPCGHAKAIPLSAVWLFSPPAQPTLLSLRATQPQFSGIFSFPHFTIPPFSYSHIPTLHSAPHPNP